MDVARSASSASNAEDPSDLLDSIESTLAQAEPISAEDDLIVRMNAVSKVKRGGSSSARRERKQQRERQKTHGAKGPSKSITKHQRARKEAMTI